MANPILPRSWIKQNDSKNGFHGPAPLSLATRETRASIVKEENLREQHGG